MITDLTINKPQPFESKQALALFDRTTDVKSTIKGLEAGVPVLISEFYSDGLVLLKELRMHLNRKLPNLTFKEQRAYRAQYRKLSNLVYIEVANGQLIPKKAPKIGWLEKFYPNEPPFLLSFVQVQGLNSSWQWYTKGVSIPTLRNKVHPYYGTYFPTRFDHLILFDNWLKRYDGPKKGAIEVGIGSGVLSFMMVKHGFQKVFGTDTNPNAIFGLAQFMGDTKLSRKIELDFAPLFGKWEKQTELIVFNPPWLPESTAQDGDDRAIYYNSKLFPDFFEGAKQRLLPEGKLVIIFSNLAQITNVTTEHPIEHELAQGGRFVLENCYTKSVKAASNKTTRDIHWRATEKVELWELVHK
jgi:hypothetical protein